MFSLLEFRTCQNQMFIDKVYEYISCLWYVVAGDLSPLFLCVSMCVCKRVCVSCFRCVAEECIDVFRGPWEAHTGASCSFICCSWRNVARENSQTELSKGACHPHEMCVCVCVSACVCVWDGCMFLLFRDCSGLQAFFFSFFLHVFFFVLLYGGERGSGKHSGLILSQGTTDSLQLQENFLCGILTVSCR